MEVILLNGAKYAGKDTLADRLMGHLPNAHSMMFKTPLYTRAMAKFNLTHAELMTYVNGPVKEEPSDVFDGVSPRQALIDISEKEIKVEQGECGVVALSLQELLDVEECGRKTFIYRDSGFEYEREFMERVLKKYGLTRLIIVRITRAGTNYDGDSRGYLSNPDIIINNDNNESSETLGDNMFKQFIEQYNKL